MAKANAALLLFAAVTMTAAIPECSGRGQLPNERVIIGSDMCVNIDDCPAFEPYRRITDVPYGPVYWVVSIERHACIVDEATFALALAMANKPYNCPDKWRFPRRRRAENGSDFVVEHESR